MMANERPKVDNCGALLFCVGLCTEPLSGLCGSSDQYEPLFKCERGDHAKEKSESVYARNKIRYFFAGDMLRCMLRIIMQYSVNFYIPDEEELFNIFTKIDIIF